MPGGRPTNESKKRQLRELNEKQLLYVNWIASPVSVRKPKTLQELAAFLNVHEATLWRWGQDPQIALAARYVGLQRSGDPERITVALDFLYKNFNGVYESEDEKKFALACVKEWLKAVGVHDTFKTSSDLLSVEYQDDLDLSALSDSELWSLQRKYQELRDADALPALEVGIIDVVEDDPDYSENTGEGTELDGDDQAANGT